MLAHLPMRLARWKEAGEAAPSLNLEAITVQAGEVWHALDGPKAVVPVVVIAPCARISNGLRPENDRSKPILLKDCETLGLHVFGKELTTSPVRRQAQRSNRAGSTSHASRVCCCIVWRRRSTTPPPCGRMWGRSRSNRRR